MKKNYSKSLPKEINVQKNDIFRAYHSNSLIHYKDISSYNYEHRIRLDPSGEKKNYRIALPFPYKPGEGLLYKIRLFIRIQK
jgi:hypothetical protein